MGLESFLFKKSLNDVETNETIQIFSKHVDSTNYIKSGDFKLYQTSLWSRKFQ